MNHFNSILVTYETSLFEEDDDIFKDLQAIETNEKFIQYQKKKTLWNQNEESLKLKIEQNSLNLKDLKIQNSKIEKDYEQFIQKKSDFEIQSKKKKDLDDKLDYLYQQKSEIEKMILRVKMVNENKDSSWISNFKKEIEIQKNSKVYGTLNELAMVDKEYYIALNTVLYSQIMNSVIVESKSDALKLIKEFSQKKIGVISCIIVEDQEIIRRNENFPQCLIPLSSIIKTNSKFQNIFDKLTNNWYIAKNREDGMKFSFENGKIRRNIVTLDGEIFRSNGEIRGKRSAKFQLSIPYPQFKDTNFINFTSETSVNYDQLLKEKEKEIQIIKDEIKSIQLVNLEAQLNQLSRSQNKRVFITQKIKELEKEKLRLESNYQEIQFTNNEEIEYQKFIEKRNELYEKSKDSKSFILNEKEEIQKELSKCEKDLKKFKNRKLNIEKEIENLQKSNNELSKKFSEFKMNPEEFESLKKERTKIKKEMNKREKEIQEFNSETLSFERTLEKIESKIKKNQQEILELRKIEKDLQDEIQQIISNEELDQISWIKQIKKNKEKANETLKQMKYNLIKIQEQLETEKKKVSIKDIETMQEYQKQKKDFLDQFQNIESEITKYQKSKLDFTIERFEKFHSSCQQINQNIEIIFKELNPSSNCYLSYPEDKIGAFEEGVIIHCKTDGTWKSFNKLSGGQQALCACAISLSFQQIFTSPIFFYDEIDASLDTLNTEKLSKLLQKMPSQFICVSLRPNMYESANELIGVYQLNNTSKTISKVFGEMIQ